MAKGFSQREAIDLDETFAPVARHVTMRVLLAKAPVENLIVEQIDVKTTFLNGPLKEDIYIEPPAVNVNYRRKRLTVVLERLPRGHAAAIINCYENVLVATPSGPIKSDCTISCGCCARVSDWRCNVAAYFAMTQESHTVAACFCSLLSHTQALDCIVFHHVSNGVVAEMS